MVVVGLNFYGKALILRMLALSSLFFLSAMLLAEEEISEKPGKWERQLEMLRAVPYVGFGDAIVAGEDVGVVLYNPEKTYDGYNVYATIWSGEVFLMDMDGRVVHRWTCLPMGDREFYNHAIVLENGDLVIIRRYRSLLKFTWDSQLIWEKKLKAHHDVVQTREGLFYVLVREEEAYRGLKVRFDAIVCLTADGEEIDRWYTHDHLAEIKRVLDTRSFLDTALDSLLSIQSLESKKSKGSADKHYDYFHMNTISLLPATVLDEKHSPFREGNLLVCFRNVNQIAVLEKDTYRILWAWGEGELQWPHHPTMLENGHILIFDNGVERQYSRVVELDPITEAIVWEYTAEPPEDFYSRSRGSAQRLPNGNTLICESNNGRVFEVTKEGEVVWMWLNPGIRSGYRKIVYRMARLRFPQLDDVLARWWWWE